MSAAVRKGLSNANVARSAMCSPAHALVSSSHKVFIRFAVRRSPG